MILVHTVAELQKALSSLSAEGKTIGFVPTMGALHSGHISLVEECRKNNDICVVSVFVNPTQFNDPTDYEKYPRNIQKDADLLEKFDVDYVFIPSAKEVYPEPDSRQFDFGQLDKVMEGKFRPGHFNGVAQVVSRLFDIVKPNVAYFGEKDFQQLAIIREMVKQLDLPILIMGMPIVREDSGLALSSRNERLSESQKELAVKISKALSLSKKLYSNNSVSDTIKNVTEQINSNDDLSVEYFEIVDGLTLQSINDWTDTEYAVGCITVFCGEVRLIDNITYFSSL